MVISYPMSTSSSSNVTNLNQFRKKKARAEKRAAADRNAVKFGLSKVQKHVDAFEAAKAKSVLDGAKTDACNDTKPTAMRDAKADKADDTPTDEANDDHDSPPR